MFSRLKEGGRWGTGLKAWGFLGSLFCSASATPWEKTLLNPLPFFLENNNNNPYVKKAND